MDQEKPKVSITPDNARLSAEQRAEQIQGHLRLEGARYFVPVVAAHLKAYAEEYAREAVAVAVAEATNPGYGSKVEQAYEEGRKAGLLDAAKIAETMPPDEITTVSPRSAEIIMGHRIMCAIRARAKEVGGEGPETRANELKVADAIGAPCCNGNLCEACQSYGRQVGMGVAYEDAANICEENAARVEAHSPLLWTAHKNDADAIRARVKEVGK